jgi:SAM-dependent methyltransferase
MNFEKKDLSYITFEDFKQFALDNSLSPSEKIGFPDAYRKGYDALIFEDIKSKLNNFNHAAKTVLDLGCGCSELAKLIVEYSQKQRHRLILADSAEMLNHLPNDEHLIKITGKFPDNFNDYLPYKWQIDTIIIYSVIHHVILEDSLIAFLDSALELLAPGGELLIGDIPNISKRNRFFASPEGIKCHQEYTKSQEIPKVNFTVINHNKVDDGVVMGILQRYRNYGFESYLLPQSKNLAMSTRREDILVVKRS